MAAKTPRTSVRQVERIAVALESIAQSLKRIESVVNDYDQVRVASESRINPDYEPTIGVWPTDEALEKIRDMLRIKS